MILPKAINDTLAEPVVCGRPRKRGLFLEIQLRLFALTLELLWVANELPYSVFIQTHGAHAVTAQSKRAAKQRILRLQQFPVDRYRTLALQLSDRHGDGDAPVLSSVSRHSGL